MICVLGHAAACGFCGSYRLCDDFVSLFLAFETKIQDLLQFNVAMLFRISDCVRPCGACCSD